MTAQTTHAELEARGLTKAPHVNPITLEALVASEHYFTGLEGSAGACGIDLVRQTFQVPVPSALDLLTICVLVLHSGFTVVGKSACVSPENFDAEMGRRIAREDAIRQLWTLEGYRLKHRLYESNGS